MLQCLSIPPKLKEVWPNAEIHWATRPEFAQLLVTHPDIHQVWTLPKKLSNQSGLSQLWSFARNLHQQNFTHIYDAHHSTRSLLIYFFFVCFEFMKTRWPTFQITRKSQKRWKRFLLFRFHVNTYEMPFSGQRDLLEPLQKWGISNELPQAPQFYFPKNFQPPALQLPEKFIALAPSAAHVLKRWPVEHWKKLIGLLPEQNFVLLGGPQDHFLNELVLGPRVLNLAGKISFIESAWVVSQSQLLISNDTGPMHFGEQLGHPTIALMGPAPFGFPSRKTTRVMELDLSCRPCSKHGQGPCTNKEFQKCLQGISPEKIKNEAVQILSRTKQFQGEILS